jgi:isoaspartyl peptidase/L-asparaginase-like protein (Ntn-hydrolase superfamily)
MKRRDFVKVGAIGSTALILNSCSEKTTNKKTSESLIRSQNIKAISTWNAGLEANKVALIELKKGESALNAIEKGLNVTESDPNNTSVGIGGMPDENGLVTLDACIMDHEYNCGSVSFLQNIEHPISVARKVMENTPHIMLSGKGAYDFAIKNGFDHQNLLTESSLKKWLEWTAEKEKSYPEINHENHDTIAMITIDQNGQIAAGCTTSGWAYKLHGRVGDSPIIGAGVYVDPEVGAACATGMGEAVIKICGTHAVVEQMRNGLSPNEACKAVVERVKKSNKDLTGLQVGFIAMNIAGDHGAHSMYNGFEFAVENEKESTLTKSPYEFEWD